MQFNNFKSRITFTSLPLLQSISSSLYRSIIYQIVHLSLQADLERVLERRRRAVEEELAQSQQQAQLGIQHI